MKRIIQIEKVLKLQAKAEWPKYCPPPESIKKLYFVAYNLQFKRGRRLALRVPIFFIQQLLPSERYEISLQLHKIRCANWTKAKAARLKRRRFYMRAPLKSMTNRLKRIERVYHDEYE